LLVYFTINPAVKFRIRCILLRFANILVTNNYYGIVIYARASHSHHNKVIILQILQINESKRWQPQYKPQLQYVRPIYKQQPINSPFLPYSTCSGPRYV